MNQLLANVEDEYDKEEQEPQPHVFETTPDTPDTAVSGTPTPDMATPTPDMTTSDPPVPETTLLFGSTPTSFYSS